jgi:hypothetical protein
MGGALMLAAAVAGCGQPTAQAPTTERPTPSPSPSASAAPTPSLRPASPTGSPGTTFSRTFTFRDDSTQNALSASLDPGARDAGHFAFQIAGQSVVSGTGTLAATPAGALSLTYDGPASLQPTLDLSKPDATPAFSSRPVTIALRATIAADRRTADATLSIGAERHVVASRLPDGRDVPAVLDAIERGFLNDDPAAVYALLSVVTQSVIASERFGSDWRKQNAADGDRRIVGMTRGEIGAVESQLTGWATIRIAYRIEVRRTSGTSVSGSEMVLIHEPSGWKLLYTSEQ